MSVATDVMDAGGIGTFNLEHGFPEAVVRGFRSGLLTDYDYHHLTQCETLEDMKMNLQETDYDQFMSNEQHITPASFREKALQKLVQEMDFLRAHAVEPLATFLDYISYEFMIDNVMLLLKGTLSGRSANELIKQCNPLGLFKESTMRSIPTFEASPKGYADLYQTVLIDTPVGPYFSQYLEDSAEHLGDASEMRNILEEVQIEVIKNSLHKLYLEDFYRVTQAIGGETANFMGHLIMLRADRMAINITVNRYFFPPCSPSSPAGSPSPPQRSPPSLPPSSLPPSLPPF
ncbi:vacuolar atpase subunit dva41, partial [Nannochloropsis gaditana]